MSSRDQLSIYNHLGMNRLYRKISMRLKYCVLKIDSHKCRCVLNILNQVLILVNNDIYKLIHLGVGGAGNKVVHMLES